MLLEEVSFILVIPITPFPSLMSVLPKFHGQGLLDETLIQNNSYLCIADFRAFAKLFRKTSGSTDKLSNAHAPHTKNRH